MSSSLADCSVGTQNGAGFKSIDINTVQIESLLQLRTGRAATSRIQWERLPERMDHFWDYTRLGVSKYGLLAHHTYNKALAKEDNLHILVSNYIATLKMRVNQKKKNPCFSKWILPYINCNQQHNSLLASFYLLTIQREL